MINQMMRKIFLLRRSREPVVKTGLGTYADRTEEALSANGIEPAVVTFSLDKKKGILNAFVNGLIKPFFSVVGSEGTFHATDELCSFLFPFVRGRKVMTVHHVIKDNDNSGVFYRSLWNTVTKIGLRYADAVLAVSPQTKTELMEMFDVPEERITVAMSRINGQFTTRNDPAKRGNVIGCIGELIQRKNVESALRTFKMLTEMDGMSDARMKICGKGIEYERLTELAYELGISERVEFMRDLSMDQIVDLYNCLGVLSNPSMHEGFGFSTLEAQRCSVPVVYFKDAHIPKEVMTVAVPSDDERQFAENMYKLLTDSDTRTEIIEKGKDYAEKFGNDFSEKLMEVYEV